MTNAIELARLLGDERLLRNLLTVLYTKVYTPKLGGIVYEQRRDWSLYTINGRTEDWVTSEATGLALESLLHYAENAGHGPL